MKKKQVFLLALMMLALFMLCGCGAIQETSISNSGDSVTDLALRPDGEYVVLSLPDEELRFDFFRAEGKENLIREVQRR